MALTLTGITYSGEAASQFIVKALTGSDTINGGHIYVKDGIKSKFAIPRFSADIEDFVQDTADTPTTAGSMSLTEKNLVLENYTIYTEFNPRSFEDHWFATQLNETLIDRRLPYTPESVILQNLLAQHGKFINKLIWNGDKTLTTKMKYIDGVITKSVASGSTNVIGSPVALTAANIQAKMELCYAQIPAALKYNTEMKIYVSPTTYDHYMNSQIAQTYKGVDITSMGVPTYKGLPIIKINDFPNNCIFIAKGSANPASNLWLGMNSMSDEGLQLERKQANSSLWFVKAMMKLDVQIGWNEETILYKA
jgi:hypothetical protein